MTETVSQSARLDSLDALGGFDMISNGDSPAGPKMISAEMYLKYAKPYEKKIVEIASQAGVAYTLHICDNTDVTLEHMLLTGADAFELDYKTDITKIFNTIYNTTTFIGNIEPSGVLALGSVDVVQKKTMELLSIYKNSNRIILNACCAIPSKTPSLDLKMMIDTARNYR